MAPRACTACSIALLLLLVGPIRARNDAAWRLVSEVSGIRTFSRLDPVTRMTAVRAEAEFHDLSVGDLLAVFLDVKHHGEWDPSLAAVREWVESEDESTLYQLFRQQWPVRDRELLLKRRQFVDHVAKRYAARYVSTAVAPGPLERNVRAVTTTAHEVWWNFTATGPRSARIEHYSCVDPGGVIPKWVRDKIVQVWCRNQIDALRKTVRRLGLGPRPEFAHWGAATPNDAAPTATPIRDLIPAACDDSDEPLSCEPSV